MARRKELRKETVAASEKTKISRGWLDTIGLIAQISLAVVAIFGYFYTVRPIYQKERLAEQVAEYDGIIKKQAPKIAETEQRLAALQREREQLSNQFQNERSRLTAELVGIEKQLVLAREEKSKIEDQIQFMTFRYRLPDGRPAITQEQVRAAQIVDLKRSFLSSLAMCGFAASDGVFPSYSYADEAEGDKFWPFTEKEISTWKEYGAKFPLKRAKECIDSSAATHTQRYPDFSADTERLRRDATQNANRLGAELWTPPAQPEDMLKDLAAGRTAIESDRAAAIKKVETEYGDWASTLFPSRREILKHNYFTLKQQAEGDARIKRISLDYDTQRKANAFRQSIQTEVNRLVTDPGKGK
jgi:transcriptional regulator with XRE-family HTH domain